MKLYDNEKSSHQSSLIGGLLTICCIVFVISIAINIIYATINKENTYVEERAVPFKDTIFGNMTYK